jgi:transcriptional regulator with XRE-family HTH domain
MQANAEISNVTATHDRINFSNAKALRRAREIMKLTRNELALRLNISTKAIEKYENGRAILDDDKINFLLAGLELNREQFYKIKKGKGFKKRGLGLNRTVHTNHDRRSYRKIITRECEVLRSMRRIKKLSQDQASSLCGYPRSTIGHIENGRIELTIERIKHIVESYGYQFHEYEVNFNRGELRDQIIDECCKKIELLDDSKLEIVKNLLRSL